MRPLTSSRHLFGNPFDFVNHPTRLNLRGPVIDVALALALTDFQGLGGHRRVRKDPDPDLAATLDVTVDRPAPRLDLPRRHRPARRRLEPELAEVDLVAAARETGIPAFLLLAEFGAFWLQHACLTPLLPPQPAAAR